MKKLNRETVWRVFIASYCLIAIIFALVSDSERTTLLCAAACTMASSNFARMRKTSGKKGFFCKD